MTKPKLMTLQEVTEAASRLTGRKDWEPCAKPDDSEWRSKVAAYMQLSLEAQRGNPIAVAAVQEAMSTSDFPLLLGDTLNREVQEKYRSWPPMWQGIAWTRTVKDYRTVKSFTSNAVNGLMGEIGEMGSNTPTQNKQDRTPVEYAVKDYATHAKVNTRALINDDVGEFSSIPTDFAQSAIHTESYLFTSQFIGSSGPTGLTLLTGNPVFGVLGLKAAFKQLLKVVDPISGMPIMMEAPTLMVGGGLAIDAREVVKATSIELVSSASSSDRRFLTENWIGEAISRVVVNPWMDYIMNTNEDTSWCLFANASPGRAAIERAVLQGKEEPRVYVKASDQMRVGGGMAPITDGQFNEKTIEYKSEHTIAFKLVNALYGYRSNGTGS